MSGSYQAFETLAVTSGAAVGFTAGTGTPGYGNTRIAAVAVEGGPIRYRFDGVADPTTTVGMPAPAGSYIYLTSRDQLVKFRAIATGVDAKCIATFGY